jgi:hypothetical protein
MLDEKTAETTTVPSEEKSEEVSKKQFVRTAKRP